MYLNKVNIMTVNVPLVSHEESTEDWGPLILHFAHSPCLYIDFPRILQFSSMLRSIGDSKLSVWVSMRVNGMYSLLSPHIHVRPLTIEYKAGETVDVPK